MRGSGGKHAVKLGAGYREVDKPGKADEIGNLGSLVVTPRSVFNASILIDIPVITIYNKTN